MTRRGTKRGRGARRRAEPVPREIAWWRSPFLRLVGSTGLAIGIAWIAFHAWHDPTFVLTSLGEGVLPRAPVYGFFRPEATPFVPQATSFVLLAVALLVGGSVLWQWIPSTKRGLFLAFVVVFAAAFRLAVHAVGTAALPGAQFLFYPGEDVLFDVSRINSVGAFLRDYTDLQPDLSLHGRTKPPGFALLHYGIQSWVGDNVQVVGSLLSCAASLIVLPVFYLGKALRGKLEDGRVCAMLAATAPSLVSFGAVSLDAIYAVIAATIFLVALLELRQPDRLLRIGLGLLLFLAMMLSYSTFIMGFFVASTLILERFRRPRACAVHLVQILAGFLLPFVWLYLSYGFDAVACFTSARELNTAIMRQAVGQPLTGFAVWIYSSVGNVLAFSIYLGLPIAGSWFRLPRQGLTPVARVFAGGVFLAFGVACFGGMYLMETERVLLFLVPGATLLAVLSPGFRPAAAVLLVGLQAIAMDLLLFTLW